MPNDGVLKTDGGDEVKTGEENGGIEPPELWLSQGAKRSGVAQSATLDKPLGGNAPSEMQTQSTHFLKNHHNRHNG